MPGVLRRKTSPLTDTVVTILENRNLYILGDADLFIAALHRFGNQGNREVRFLLDNLNDEVLQPFAEILADCTILDENCLRDASRHSAVLLGKHDGADFVVAASAMEHIGDGVCAHLSKQHPIDVVEPRNIEKQSLRRTGASLAVATLLIIVLLITLTSGVTLSFDGNGAGRGTTSAVYSLKGSEVVLPISGFQRDGYVFKGWSQSPNGVVEFAPGEAIKLSASLRLYALWSPIVTFDGNGADSGTIEPAPIDDSHYVGLPENTFVRKGYRFAGWSRTKDGKDATASGEDVSINSPTTFYAVWRATVSFDGNGASSGSMESVAQDSKGKVKVPACSFKREGCDFIGWLESPSKFKQGTYYEDEDLLQPGQVLDVNDRPTTLHACWRYSDSVVSKLGVEKIVRSGKEGKTLILLITNNTDYVMDIEGEMRYVSASGEVLGKETIFSPSVAQKDVVAPTFADYGKGKGTFEYTIEARPARHSNKSIHSRITTKEVSVKKGYITLQITNTSKETLHLLDVKAYATQANSPYNGGFAYCGGDGYDSTLKPGASTTANFGSDDWGAPWPSLERSYYFDGYAE